MTEHMEFCPKCNGTQKMAVSLGLMPIETDMGPDVVLLYHLHCTSCNTYVRSIPIEQEDSIPLKAAAVPSLPSPA